MKDLGEGSPYFGYKKKEITEGRKAGRQAKHPPPPPPILVQGLDLPVLLPESYMYDCQLRNETEVVVLNKLRLSPDVYEPSGPSGCHLFLVSVA